MASFEKFFIQRKPLQTHDLLRRSGNVGSMLKMISH
jgi:hypothetical protein